MKRIACIALVLLLGVALAQGSENPPTLAEVLQQREDLTTFTSLLERTGMLSEVAEPGSFTLFVPTNAAFDELDDEAFEELQRQPGVIEEILRNHISLGGSDAQALARMGTFTNIAGYQFYVQEDGDWLRVNEARVLEPDLAASNGYVHVIDAVLVPEPFFPMKNQSTVPAGGTQRGTD